MMNIEKIILEAKKISESNTERSFNKKITDNVDIMISKIDNNKSILVALVTSCIKKMENPRQDIRLHRKDFEGGYSARSLDTQVTTPLFKKYFPKYANKESSFLTLATRERIKWSKVDGTRMKIRNGNVKKSFLSLIEVVQKLEIEPKDCLIYIFLQLFILTKQEDLVYNETIEAGEFSEIININTVIHMLEKHFEVKNSSRLPVIAIYTIYQMLIKVVKRYENKDLRPLNVHTSSDKHGFGDIEIWNGEKPFEMVEIKHNIPIDRNMVFDIVKKTQATNIKRYYLLTTYTNSFSTKEEEEYINKFILQIKKTRDLEIIPNGIIYSLKYYMRFIEDYVEFIKKYTQNLINDSKNSTEVNVFHIRVWKTILQEHEIQNSDNWEA